MLAAISIESVVRVRTLIFLIFMTIPFVALKAQNGMKPSDLAQIVKFCYTVLEESGTLQST